MINLDLNFFIAAISLIVTVWTRVNFNKLCKDCPYKENYKELKAAKAAN